jgi:hypothetical protein
MKAHPRASDTFVLEDELELEDEDVVASSATAPSEDDKSCSDRAALLAVAPCRVEWKRYSWEISSSVLTPWLID